MEKKNEKKEGMMMVMIVKKTMKNIMTSKK